MMMKLSFTYIGSSAVHSCVFFFNSIRLTLNARSYVCVEIGREMLLILTRLEKGVQLIRMRYMHVLQLTGTCAAGAVVVDFLFVVLR